MHRYQLVQSLVRYASQHPTEVDVVERIIALVEEHADCFLRTCRPGHITGAAWVVSSDHSRVALVHHRKLGRWLQPGGHADGDGDVVNVAWKEATEETGLDDLSLVDTGGSLVPLDIDVHTIPARYDAQGNLIEDAHEHHDIRFLFVAGPKSSCDASLQVSHESHAVEWFDHPSLRAITDEPSVIRLLDKAAAWLS